MTAFDDEITMIPVFSDSLARSNVSHNHCNRDRIKAIGTVKIFSTLRAKTLGVLLVTFAGLVAAVYIVSRIVLLDSFTSLEKDNMIPNVHRVLNTLSDDIAGLDAELSNWVNVVDISNVEGEPDAEFSRLLTEAFTNLEINYTMVFDLNDRILFSKAVDLQSGMDVPFPSSFQEHFAAQDLLLQHASPDSRTTGFISLPEGPMLIAARPVPDSANDDPVGGTMLFARHLDDDQIAVLAQSAQLSLEIRKVSDIEMPSDFQEALHSLNKPDLIVTRRLNEDEVSAYTLLEDVYGDPSFVIKADMPSTIYQEGLSTLNYLIIAVILVGLFFGLVTIVGLEKLVLSRVTTVRSEVDSISSSGDSKRRLSVWGSDELSGLAKDVNRMLDQLEAAEEQVQVQNRTLRNLNIRLSKAQESERRFIARELHDEIGQQLTGIGYLLGTTSGLASEEIQRNVDHARTRLQELITTVSDLSTALRPSQLDDLGLSPALDSLVRQYQALGGMQMRFEHDELEERLPSDTETAAYRIVQEALTNVFRHSAASEVVIKVNMNNKDLKISVEDNGVGFNPLVTEPSSTGLAGMRERAENLGGQLTVESSPGNGTRMQATLLIALEAKPS